MSQGSNRERNNWRRFEDVAYRNINGECVIVPIRSSPVDLTRVFLLNKVGSHLWLALENSCTEEHLTESVLKRFDVEEDQAKTDVVAFLDQLLKLQLVETLN